MHLYVDVDEVERGIPLLGMNYEVPGSRFVTLLDKRDLPPENGGDLAGYCPIVLLGKGKVLVLIPGVGTEGGTL